MKIPIFRFTFFIAICLNLLSVAGNTLLWALAESSEPTVEYVFETIEVPGVDFLELTSTNDLGHYAGNTRSPDGEKIVGFTLVDGVFSTYDVPGSLKTVFYGLNNAGQAVGFYRDSDEVDHGVIVQDAELTQFDFPGAAQTEIYGISETGILAGNIIDAAGVFHGFMGDMQIDVPGAIRTYADHVNAAGILVGSYTDADGINHGYMRLPDGSFVNVDAHDTHHSEDDFIDVDAHDTLSELEFLFVNAISDTGLIVFRAKAVDDIQRSYIVMPNAEPMELRVPGSVITIARDIDAQGRIAGYYDTPDGRRHGFIGSPTASGYSFEPLEVPGVDFLELTSKNDLGHYAGNTRSPDGENMIGFTLIDGVLSTYDVPGSLTFGFYGLNNAGQVVGFYQDANEVSHGVVVKDGELTQFDFPGAAETEIFGVSESGLLIGDIFDADGAIHGFVGSEQFDVPGAVTTYADDMNAAGTLVGSYVDADGVYHGYMRHADGRFTTFDFPGMLSHLEYLFVNAINDAGIIVFRAKEFDSLERTYIRLPNGELKELKFPGSVTTVARDIDRAGRVAGYFDALDGRRYGFIATPFTSEIVEDYSNVYVVSLPRGLNMLSVPLKPEIPMTARSFAEKIGATAVIALDEARQEFVGWTPDAPDDGFPIEGGKGIHRQSFTVTTGHFCRSCVDESTAGCCSTEHDIK